MREINPESFTVFTLDELGAKQRECAVWNMRHKLTGDWWDEGDMEAVREEIRFGLAVGLGSPGYDRFGPGDFPGIDGVELVSWDLDRGDAVGISGILTRDNATTLPWTDEIEAVHLATDRWTGHTLVGVAPTADAGEPPAGTDAMHDAVFAAIERAKRDGRTQLEYLTSDERAEEWALDNGQEFYSDGRLYLG